MRENVHRMKQIGYVDLANPTGTPYNHGNMNTSNAITINTASMNHINSGMMSDDMSDDSSPESSSFDTSDLLNSSVNDDVTAQLAAAGPIGMAAAAAIASSRKRKHPYHFETNPSKRKRQQTRLLRKLKNTIDEYATRVGQQAVVLCCTPGKILSQSLQSFKVFGSQPLEGVMRNNKNLIMQKLDMALAEQTPVAQPDNSGLHELPALVIDGIPTPVDKMTQAQLRNFIPEMLKYSTGRSKPGWGKEECRPPWWPDDLPWANVRSDARTEEDKKSVSWTEALRTIVKNCYKHHGREDLLQVFNEETNQTSASAVISQQAPHLVQAQPGQYGGTMVQTINNPDGTVSIIQIETGPQSLLTLPDGTQATVVHAVQPHQVQTSQDSGQIQTLTDVTTHQDLSALSASMGGATLDLGGDHTHHLALNQAGHLILAQDGQLGGIVTIPVSMYQTMTAANNLITSIGDTQTMQVAMAPLVADGMNTQQLTLAPATTKNSVPDATQAVEVITVEPHQASS